MKKICFAFLICFLLIQNTAMAKNNDFWHGEISFGNENPKQSSAQYCQQADTILRYFNSIKNKTKADEQKYLNAAKYFYYQAMRADKSNTDALVGKARIALYENHIRDAKNALSIALNINENNPKVTYYLGETFFKDGEFAKAVDFYLHAYTHGYKNNFWTNYKLGVTYEKLDVPEKAKIHYQNALKINPNSKEAEARLAGLDMIKTDYETYRKKIEANKNKTEPLPPDVNDILFGDKRMQDKIFNAYYIDNQPVYLDELYPLDESDMYDLSDLIINPMDTEFVIDLDYLCPDVILQTSDTASQSLIIPESQEEAKKHRPNKEMQPLEKETTIKEQLPVPNTFRGKNNKN